MKVEQMKWKEFAAKYCERQVQTPEGLLKILQAQKKKYDPDGWAMLECQMLDGSRLGELTILVYGPRNTFHAPPERPVSPRGLASDMAVVVAVLPASEIQAEG